MYHRLGRCVCHLDAFLSWCVAAAQVAVYKDPSGEVQKFSGLCPHLGCLLQVRWLSSGLGPVPDLAWPQLQQQQQQWLLAGPVQLG